MSNSGDRLLIKIPKFSKRLQYTFHYLLNTLWGINHEFTLNDDEYIAWQGPRMIYGGSFQKNEVWFEAVSLLFERNIAGVDTGKYSPHGGLFPVYSKDSALPFDAFASSFYMLSRYEEYLPCRKDIHGRFQAKESIAYREGFLDKAVVNHWAEMIVSILLKKFPDLQFHKTSYKYVPTIDVDLAYSYLHKGFLRTLGGYIKNLLHADFEEIKSRTQVLMGKERDPFDSFDSLQLLHSSYRLKPVFFFLFSDYGQFDKNLSIYNPAFRTLIKRIADYAIVGIHPSYASNKNPQKLKKEIEDLSKCLHRQVTHSRQHFLKLSLPETYRNLIHCGITDDYTMGFADQPGFRAGTCIPFPFYDLDLDTPTSLLIHPFIFMDGTLKDYLKIPENQIVDFVKPYIEEVKRYSGTLITLWHNETHGGSGRWKGWPEIYETIVSLGASSSTETS
ncbi:MAG TPA: polysaccharide deacetylase family protein [Bacteroidales bacterium]|nr:polysaccharide deacetylase family protein [Bacteroidales bacterium]